MQGIYSPGRTPNGPSLLEKGPYVPAPARWGCVAEGRAGRRLPAERVLHDLWRRSAAARDRGGRIYRIVYPGRPSDGAGPDFRDAVLEMPDGVRVHGDIEIHVRPSGWTAHGHDSDPRYNGVAFHVAALEEAADAGAATTAAGVRIPLLLMGLTEAPSTRSQPARRRSKPPSPRQQAPEGDADAAPPLPAISLDEAGDRRFLAHSAGFELELRRASGDDLLWTAILECLGYSGNRRGFRQLAARLPWSMLPKAWPAARDAPAAARYEPLLLWAAGLAPDPRLPGLLPRLGGARPEWASAAGRPDNRPARRISGAAALAARFAQAGGPMKFLGDLVGSEASPREVTEALTVPAPRGESRALIGRSRAADIAVNGVLPALHAVARRGERWRVHERCLALYRDYPQLAENSITREMRRLLKASGRPVSRAGARQQQGLIYLYRAMTRPVELSPAD